MLYYATVYFYVLFCLINYFQVQVQVFMAKGIFTNDLSDERTTYQACECINVFIT